MLETRNSKSSFMHSMGGKCLGKSALDGCVNFHYSASSLDVSGSNLHAQGCIAW